MLGQSSLGVGLLSCVIAVVSKQMLAFHLLLFPCLALGSFNLATFLCTHSCTLPPTVFIITSPETNTVISSLIHCLFSLFFFSFHSYASFYSCSEPLNAGHTPDLPESSSHLYNWNLLLLRLLFTSLSESTSPILLNFFSYRPQAPECDSLAFSWWLPLFCLQLQTAVSNQHRACLIIKLDKWDSAFIFCVITGRDSNNVSSNNLVA